MNEHESMSRTTKCVEKKKTRKRRRVTDDDFQLLRPGEEEFLHSRNYRVTQLKDMCRHYKQRVSGNKDELTKRLFGFSRQGKNGEGIGYAGRGNRGRSRRFVSAPQSCGA